MRAIRYIGKRSPWRDNIYGTGIEFRTGESVKVEDLLAVRFLKHRDSFEEVIDEVLVELSEEAVLNQEAPDEKEKKEQVHQEIMMLQHMKAKPLSDYVFRNFGLKLDTSLPLEERRQLAISYFDTIGPLQ